LIDLSIILYIDGNTSSCENLCKGLLLWPNLSDCFSRIFYYKHEIDMTLFAGRQRSAASIIMKSLLFW